MPREYARIARFIQEHPWAITPSALELMLEIVDRRIAGMDIEPDEKQARVDAARRPETLSPPPPGAIAVLPIYGIVSHRMHLMRNVSSSGTSTEAVAAAFRQVVRDPDVGAVVLDVDSPGGSVFGVQELADEIHAARGTKPVVAVASSVAASAAYWIASQADELVVTPSGEVGSIGVIAAHDDVSKAAETKGVKRTFITAGRHKAEGNPFEPLSDEARAYIQASVDRYYDAFVRSVARGRKVSLTKARGEEFGEGRMLGAADAVEVGMADSVGTLQQTIDRLQAKLARPSRSRVAAEDPELARARLQLAVAAAGG
jgi:signal peptide peptidase SppA